MSLDIRRIRETPYKKLEKPNPEKFVIRYQIAALLQSVLAPGAALTAFMVPAWWLDFGASTGAGQRLVLIITLGLLVVFSAAARVLSAKAGGKLTTSERLLFFIGVILIGGSLFGGDWRTALGLNQIPSPPYLPELILLFAWIGLIARLPQRGQYAKLLLAGGLLGSTVFSLSIAARYFIFGNHDLLTTLAAQSWPAVLSVSAMLLLVFAMWHRGAARAVWSVALVIHLVVIFLFDQNLSWIILLAATTVLLMAQIAASQKLLARDFIYPLQVWVVSLLLLVVPIKFFTGVNPLPPEAYGQTVLGQAVKINLSPWSLLPAGLAAAARALEQSTAASTELNLDTLQKSASLPNLPLVSNSYIQLYFALGIIGSLLWLLFWLLWFRNGYIWLRDHGQSLKNRAMSEEVYLGTAVLAGAVVLLAAMAFTAWSLPLAWFLFTLVGITMALCVATGRAKPSFLSEIWERAREQLEKTNAAIWLNRAGAAGVVILYVALVIVSSRVVGAERSAAGAAVAEVGVRYNHWEKAAQKNPWSHFYKLKLAQSRLDVLSDGTPLADQKEAFEAINKTLLTTVASPEPVFPWLSALLYGQMEKYVEGSVKLAQQAYLRAYKLWPNNVALGTQIAKFYREKTEQLVSSEVTGSQLRSEAKDYVKHALKQDNGYLPARLELALIIEKEGDLPGAVAELEPWENDSPEIKYHVGRLYFNDNQVEAAVDKFLAVLREVPNHSNALYSLGVAYYRQGKYNEALKEFEEVDRLNPGSEDVAGKIEEVKKRVK